MLIEKHLHKTLLQNIVTVTDIDKTSQTTKQTHDKDKLIGKTEKVSFSLGSESVLFF